MHVCVNDQMSRYSYSPLLLLSRHIHCRILSFSIMMLPSLLFLAAWGLLAYVNAYLVVWNDSTKFWDFLKA